MHRADSLWLKMVYNWFRAEVYTKSPQNIRWTGEFKKWIPKNVCKFEALFQQEAGNNSANCHCQFFWYLVPWNYYRHWRPILLLECRTSSWLRQLLGCHPNHSKCIRVHVHVHIGASFCVWCIWACSLYYGISHRLRGWLLRSYRVHHVCGVIEFVFGIYDFHTESVSCCLSAAHLVGLLRDCVDHSDHWKQTHVVVQCGDSRRVAATVVAILLQLSALRRLWPQCSSWWGLVRGGDVHVHERLAVSVLVLCGGGVPLSRFKLNI